ncbi:MAG TPA: M13 family metallopeptidase [Thermoanaerobaculia bacterium]|nr:M13 family metallopeptidase [Thermoanaerobaculia bacterium]
MRRFALVITMTALTLVSLSAPTALAQDSTSAKTKPAPAKKAAAAAPTAFIGDHGFDVSGVDKEVKPCDDFYRFAVGKWRESHPLPAQYARFGRFEELADRNRDTLHAILEEDAKKTDPPKGSIEQKVGDYYAACMNETAIEAEGFASIQPELDRIAGLKDIAALQDEITRLHVRGVSPLFRFASTQDFKNSKMTIAVVGQGGLALPDRDYYLRDDPKSKDIRAKYVGHVTKMLVLTGEDVSAAAAEAYSILALETKMAGASMPRVEQRNPENVYHITKVSDLNAMTPSFQWTRFLHDVGAPEIETLNLAQPNYIKEAGKLLTSEPLETWRAYLRWHTLNAAAATLPKAFADEEFAFNGRVLSGQKEQQERWKRCVRSADAAVGQLVGQEYVKRTFTPEAKKKALSLIDNLVVALRADIPTLSWMGPETKQAALTKLNAFARRIGYPDKWRDYSALQITRSSYAANAIATREFAFARGVARINKPDDPNEWGFFTPATVNASYQPSRNDITFPAGILQPPFYDPNADDAYNYGGIGTVIGHEMTHGFDDQGAKFDPDGNLRDWWKPEDLKNFQGRAECIATEYSEFNVEPGLNINGKLVTGEAIADLGGLTLAYAAYEASLKGKPRQTLDGFTPEQRFFLGFAQVWGENMAPEEAHRRALTDPHAQGPFRVNGTVSNMPAFKKAFACAETAKMVREESKRCAIW